MKKMFVVALLALSMSVSCSSMLRKAFNQHHLTPNDQNVSLHSKTIAVAGGLKNKSTKDLLSVVVDNLAKDKNMKMRYIADAGNLHGPYDIEKCIKANSMMEDFTLTDMAALKREYKNVKADYLYVCWVPFVVSEEHSGWENNYGGPGMTNRTAHYSVVKSNKVYAVGQLFKLPEFKQVAFTRAEETLVTGTGVYQINVGGKNAKNMNDVFYNMGNRITDEFTGLAKK